MMNKKQLEKNWSKMKTVSTRRMNEIKDRNAKMYAEKTLKEERITTRLSADDLTALKIAASQEGIGYQTLLGSIIHKYLSGSLVDIKEVKKVLTFNLVKDN